MNNNDFNPTEGDLRYVADKIVAIAAESPTIENAVKDILLDMAYLRVMIYSSVDETESDSHKLKMAKKIIKENIEHGQCGLFDTPCSWGILTTVTIYEEDDLKIDICLDHECFEVFGLSYEEFDALKIYYYALNGEED